ncbi:MAG: carbohydrate transporter permease [Lachnospiraceae bacterium]|nr:carbohydrate transporter permease [Lachnospiraceae bacterium]
MRIRKIKSILFKIAKYMVLAALAYQLLYPVLYMISMSLRAPVDAYDPSIIWIPKNLTFTSFKEAFQAMKYLAALKTSLFIGVGCALLDVASCALAGYGFARFNFRFKNIFFGMVILTLIVPTQTIILPFFLNMRYFDLNGLIGVIGRATGGPESINLIGNKISFYLPSLLGAGIRSGLYIFIFRQFFASMPSALEEAAYVDGSGPLQTFLKIMLPNAKNGIVTVFLFSFVWHWNDYYLSNQLLGTAARTMTVALSSLRVDLAAYIGGQTISDPIGIVTRMQAGAILTILPLFILYSFTLRFFTDSIEHIGIK